MNIFTHQTTQWTSGLLSKLEQQETTRSTRVQKMPKVSESLRDWRSPGVNVAAREQEQLSGWGSLPARHDRWRDNSQYGKCRFARGERARVCPHALSHLEACGKKHGSMCCHALCDVDTVHECCKTTGLALFHSKQVCRRTALPKVQSKAKQSRKRKRTK